MSQFFYIYIKIFCIICIKHKGVKFMTNLSVPSSRPWDYRMNFSYTSAASKSGSFVAKATRYSIVGIAVLAVAETISEIVKLFFKLIGNTFRLYNISFFRPQEMTRVLKPNETKKICRKALIIGLAALGIGSLGFTCGHIYNIMQKAVPVAELKDETGMKSYFIAGYYKIMQSSNILLGIGIAGLGLLAGYKVCRRYHIHLPNVRNIFHVFSFRIPGIFRRRQTVLAAAAATRLEGTNQPQHLVEKSAEVTAEKKK